MWNFLQDFFVLGDEHQKMILRNKINRLKFSISDNIHIFLASLQNLFEELEIIDTNITDNEKVGILNRVLLENLRWINVFQFNNDRERCCSYVKRLIPDIAFSNIKEIKIQEENPKNTINAQINYKNKLKNKFLTSKKRRNRRCFFMRKI